MAGKLIEKRLGNKTLAEIQDDDLKEVPVSLRDYVKNDELSKILKHFQCSLEDIEMLISLSGIVEKVEDQKSKTKEEFRGDFDQMAEVPEGKYIYSENEESANKGWVSGRCGSIWRIKGE